MSKKGKMYTAGKNFTLPLTVTAWTNLTSAHSIKFYKISKLAKAAHNK